MCISSMLLVPKSQPHQPTVSMCMLGYHFMADRNRETQGLLPIDQGSSNHVLHVFPNLFVLHSSDVHHVDYTRWHLFKLVQRRVIVVEPASDIFRLLFCFGH